MSADELVAGLDPDILSDVHSLWLAGTTTTVSGSVQTGWTATPPEPGDADGWEAFAERARSLGVDPLDLGDAIARGAR